MQRILLLIGVFAVVLAATSCATQPGWTTLLDGEKGLENWIRVTDANWRAADGAIQADAKTDKASGFLLSRNAYTDFQIHAEFWVSDDANSGIFLRCEDVKEITDKSCYEANIFDQRPDPTYGTGALVGVAAVVPMPKAGGKWSTYDITVKGTQITLVFNGVKTVDVRDSRHASGPFAPQYAAGVVKFRKGQIRPI